MVRIGISELRLTSSRCSIGGENGRRGAGRRERSTEGAAKTKKVAGCMEGKRAWGDFIRIYIPICHIYIYIYLHREIYIDIIYIYIVIHPVEGQYFLMNLKLQGNPLNAVEIGHCFR